MRDYTHASFFSGIGAFDLGLERAGFRVVSHAEVKPYSCAVLETRWPGVPNLGDINAICPDGEGEHDCEIPRADVWTGGFPCSDFSIMGKRKGLLGGNRSSLGLVFLDLVRRHRPPYVILENVPGLLSSHEGRDLGLLLGALVDIGYGWSYRLLDARNFGLPQARRRVFVVAAADPADAGKVLDDSTYRGLDAPTLPSAIGAALAGGGDGSALDDPFVLGPTYAPDGRTGRVQRGDGTAYPVLPNNYQYVPEPIVAQLATRRGPVLARDDGAAYTLLPTETQYVVNEPIVIRREGHFDVQTRRDGSTFTVMPVHTLGGNTGQQYVVADDEQPVVIKRKGYDEGSDVRRDGAAFTVQPGVPGRDDQYVVDRGPGPVVLAGVFPKRAEQRSPSRADGSSYTLTPGVIPYVLEPDDDDGDWDDLPGRGRDDLLGLDGDGDERGGRDRADGSALAAAGPGRATADGGAPVGPSPETDADGVREAPGLPGRVDDSVGGGDDGLGPVDLDRPRWHVLGRACPVPIVEWMGQALRTVIEERERGAAG